MLTDDLHLVPPPSKGSKSDGEKSFVSEVKSYFLETRKKMDELCAQLEAMNSRLELNRDEN